MCFCCDILNLSEVIYVKICRNCGRECDDSAVICPSCRTNFYVTIEDMKKQYEEEQALKVVHKKKLNTLCLIGFIMSFIISIVGIVLCIVGIILSKKKSEKGAVLAIYGILVSIVKIIMEIFLFAFLTFIL